MEMIQIEDCSLIHPDTVKTLEWMKEQIKKLMQPGQPVPGGVAFPPTMMAITIERVTPPNRVWAVPLQLGTKMFNYDISINGQLSVGTDAHKRFFLLINMESSPPIEVTDTPRIVASKLLSMSYFQTGGGKSLSVSLGSSFATQRDVETGQLHREGKQVEYCFARWIISFDAVVKPEIEIGNEVVPPGTSVWGYVTPTELIGTRGLVEIRTSFLNKDLALEPGSKVVATYIPSCGGYTITSAEPRRLDLRDVSDKLVINTFENYETSGL